MESEEYLCPLTNSCEIYRDSLFGEILATKKGNREGLIKRNEGKYFCDKAPTRKSEDVGNTSRFPECLLVAILNKIEDKK